MKARIKIKKARLRFKWLRLRMRVRRVTDAFVRGLAGHEYGCCDKNFKRCSKCDRAYDRLVAVWGTDYDAHEDACYDRPVCPECKEPFSLSDHRCFACGRVVYVDDPSMYKWLEEREGSKTEMEDCWPEPMGCGGKACVETHYIKSPVTLDWHVAWGVCKKCGRRFIV